MSASAKRICQFLAACMDSYDGQLRQLPPDLQGIVRALPPCLISAQVRAYVLSDGVVVYDEIIANLGSSVPFAVLERVRARVNHCELEVTKVRATTNEFMHFLTLGLMRVPGNESRKGTQQFGLGPGISWLTIKGGREERPMGETRIFLYLDEAGWDPRWAWLFAQHWMQDNVRAAEFRLVMDVGLASKEERERLGQEVALLGITRFREVIFELEGILGTCPSDEDRFQQFFEDHPYMLSLRGKVVPKPFLACKKPVSNIEEGRIPDFLVIEPDGSCHLVEIESPAKAVFTESKDYQPTSLVTQAENQVRKWDQIIRTNSDLTDLYPGIEYYKARLIIGRSRHPAFPTYTSFQHELASLNEQRSRIRIETYDVLLEEARKALALLELVIYGFPGSLAKDKGS